MKQAAKQIIACALALTVFCVICRLTVSRTYTARIPIYQQAEASRTESERPEVAQVGEPKARDGYLSVPVRPGQAGETDIRVYDQDGNEIAVHILRVGPLRTVYDPQTAGFTGDTAVLIAITLFCLTVSAIMLWHYFRAKGPAYYAYSTIYFAGFSLFSLVTGLLMLRVTVSHILYPARYVMLSAYSTINGASIRFMMLTMPLIVIFSLAMAVSNIALLRHARPGPQNVMGLAVSLLLLLGEALGVYLYMRDFSGSEWEWRVQNTLQNVYATVFVYFECMLAGSAICGLQAARHQPAPDKDAIIILGCWFRPDGSLPPLLRGRVDRAVDFWRHQKAQTGREALLIPSGGQGRDESMAEAEAMRRYLVAQDIPERLIHPEDQSANTYQNMAFSRKIVEEYAPGGRVVYATTNYHVFRSGVWAAHAGLLAEGIGGKTVWWYWPNAFMRECAGLLRRRWKQELALLVALAAFFGLLTLVL